MTAFQLPSEQHQDNWRQILAERRQLRAAAYARHQRNKRAGLILAAFAVGAAFVLGGLWLAVGV